MNIEDKAELRSEELHNLLFSVRRSIRYHSRRQRFFDLLRKTISILSVFSGVSTVATLLSKIGDTATLISASLVAFFSTLDLVIGTSEQARKHADLAGEFVDLEKEITLAGEDVTDQQFRVFTAQRLDIERKEPPILRVLDCMCHNELLRAMGYGKEHEVKISGTQRLLAQIIDFRQHAICKRTSLP